MALECSSGTEQKQCFCLKATSVVHPEWGDSHCDPSPPASSWVEPTPAKANDQPYGESAENDGQTSPEPLVKTEELIKLAG